MEAGPTKRGFALTRWKQIAASRSVGFGLAALEMLGIFALSHRSWKGTGPGLSNGLTNLCHFPLYALLGALLTIALGVGCVEEKRALRAAFWGAALALLFGISDEWHQGQVPERNCSLFDVTTNAVAALSGSMALLASFYARSRCAILWLLGGLALATISSFVLPDAFPEANLLLHRVFFG